MTSERTGSGTIIKDADFFGVQGPEIWRARPDMAAQILMQILAANYGRHNLTNDLTPLVEDIKASKIQPFIQFSEGEPVACAALIRMNQFDVEVGRGACLPGKNGGKGAPLIEATRAWEESSVFPDSDVLRAEVRVAKATKEVPGSHATQVVCLQKMGLMPTAIAPLFHHGEPDRQELFVLASKFRSKALLSIYVPKLAPVPASAFATEDEFIVFSHFWKGVFGRELNVIRMTRREARTKFTTVRGGPLLIVRPDSFTALAKTKLELPFDQSTRFALARIPLSDDTARITGQIGELREQNFKLVGFEPVLSDKGFGVDLLMGLLSQDGIAKLVHPSFAEGVFPGEIEDALMEISLRWRKDSL